MIPEAAVDNNHMTITEFLEARIAEDEAIAQGATAGPWTTMTEETSDGDNIYYTVEHGTEQLCDMALTSRQGWHDAEHIARNNPARVLAECAAKRGIIAFDRDEQIWEPRGHSADTSAGAFTRGGPKDPCARHITRILAAVYKDHPDYQQEWALRG